MVTRFVPPEILHHDRIFPNPITSHHRMCTIVQLFYGKGNHQGGSHLIRASIRRTSLLGCNHRRERHLELQLRKEGESLSIIGGVFRFNQVLNKEQNS